jgi:predicted metal-dependent hydrolase
MSPLLDELNERCELLAEEVINLKNIVLNLQSYTMEVNKTLMEERVRILSDVVEEVGEK